VNFPEPTLSPPPDFSPIPATQTPSGRVPGSFNAVKDQLLNAPPGTLTPEAVKAAAQNLAKPSTIRPRGTMSLEEEAAHTDTGNRLRDQKDARLAEYFKGKNITPEQVAAMPEQEFNTHLKANKMRPSTGKDYSRTPEQARQDLVNKMRAPGLAPPPAP